MTEPAELGADDRVCADLVRCDVQCRVDPRDEILLLSEFGNPERMDYVPRVHGEDDRAIDGKPQHVRDLVSVTRVAVAPEELLRIHVDPERVRTRSVVL